MRLGLGKSDRMGSEVSGGSQVPEPLGTRSPEPEKEGGNSSEGAEQRVE